MDSDGRNELDGGAREGGSLGENLPHGVVGSVSSGSSAGRTAVYFPSHDIREWDWAG
jgi:hypothetical protein